LKGLLSWLSARPHRIDAFVRRHLRIYAALRVSSTGDWGRAALELSINLVFALLPVWVPLIVYPMFGRDGGPLSQIIFEQIKHGELYFIAAALLAPVFYFTFPQVQNLSRTQRTFPSHQTLILIFIFTVILAVLAIAASKLQAEEAGIPVRMVTWSEWLFALTSILFYFTLTVKNWLERGGVENILDDQSREEERIAPVPSKSGEAPAVDPDALVAATLTAHAAGTASGASQ